jgi:glycerol-3-phosphate O-acyltransferase
VIGPVHDALRAFCSDGLVRISEARGEVIYQVEDDRRSELSFAKNTLMNLIAPRSLVANAVLGAASPAPAAQVKQRALFLSRLFKLEFIYRVGATFDTIFDGHLDKLVAEALLVKAGEQLNVAPEPHARPMLEYLADLMRDYLESYLLAALTLEDVAKEPLDKKEFVKNALELGRAEFLGGHIRTSESLSRTTIENALAFLIEQKYLSEREKKVALGERPGAELVAEIQAFLRG